jgi:hypothetical protein
MVWFATPGLAGQPSASGQTVEHPSKSTCIGRLSPFNRYRKVLGRSIPIVIGTGKVDGIPVIGGAERPSRPRRATPPEHIGWGAQADLSARHEVRRRRLFTARRDDPDLCRIPGHRARLSAGLRSVWRWLRTDPLEINDEVVYDAENGIGASKPSGSMVARRPRSTPSPPRSSGQCRGVEELRHGLPRWLRRETARRPSRRHFQRSLPPRRWQCRTGMDHRRCDSLASDGGSGGTLGAAYDIADGIIYQT